MLSYMLVGILFIAGYIFGALAEYVIHWLLHAVPFKIHVDHHKSFFRETPATVARESRNIWFDLIVAAGVFALMLPLAFLTGWLVMLSIYAGMFVHLVIVYEVAHALLHDDSGMPEWVRLNSWFSYWRRCHLEHHWHRPRCNFSVTYPFIFDRLFGTFVPPRDKYRDVPIDRSKR